MICQCSRFKIAVGPPPLGVGAYVGGDTQSTVARFVALKYNNNVSKLCYGIGDFTAASGFVTGIAGPTRGSCRVESLVTVVHSSAA